MFSFKKIIKEYNVQKALTATTNYFGTTNNINEAGYILPDGKLLDLSGKKYGAMGGSRDVDHREISVAFSEFGLEPKDYKGKLKDNSTSDMMINFVNNTGAIRISPLGDYLMINIGIKEPTSRQYNVIKMLCRYVDDVRVELMDNNGDTLNYKDFGMEIDFRKPNFNKIKSFIFESFH